MIRDQSQRRNADNHENAADDCWNRSPVGRAYFMGQGSRYFPYPAESFMVGASQWIYYGGGIAIVGLVFLIIARR
jgi:hypothetical protein